MKIGILTLPLHTNYGGILQAYALQTVLERMGHEVVILNQPFHRKGLSLGKKMVAYPKRFVKKYILRRQNVKICHESYIDKVQPVVETYTRVFVNKYLHIQTVSNFNTLFSTDFDMLVVGSDQVWRPSPHVDIYHFYLDFAKDWNVKRIAYAASFGTEEWEYTLEETEKCKHLVQLFDKVTVREKSGVGLCHDKFGIHASCVLDPTMLLDKNDYISLFDVDQCSQGKHILLVYILDMNDEKESLIQKIANEKHLIPLYVNSKVEDLNADLKERIQPPVENWLKGFYNADFVITDSFHACVFSILFNKPFVVYGNKARGLARFSSLLSTFHLENRFISSADEYRNLSPIDFSQTNLILKEMKDMSIKYLEHECTK